MGYANSISSKASNGVAPDDDGIKEYAQKTSNPFGDFLNYASGVAEKAKGGVDENPEGLSSVTGTEEKPNTLVSSLMDWASDLTTISSAGEDPNPKGLNAYVPKEVKVVKDESKTLELDKISWEEWAVTKLFTLDTFYLVYGWPYFAVDDFFNKWKLYRNQNENTDYSMTFIEAVNYSIAMLSDPLSLT